MKVIAYSVRNDERKFFEEWINTNGLTEVEMVTSILDNETANLARGCGGVLLLQEQPVNDQVIGQLAKLGVKTIAMRSVGYSNVDYGSVIAHGMKLTHVPSYSPNAIAEFVIVQLLQLLRQSPRYNVSAAQGDFRWETFVGDQLNKQTVGVVGTGRIGKTVIKILQGFGANVVAFGHHHDVELEEQGLYVDTLEDLYDQSSVVTLHVPGTESNYHLVDHQAFEKMHPGTILINMARGSVVDSEALLSALQTGKIRSAALDTYEFETEFFDFDFRGRPIHDDIFRELMRMENVLITPHMAFFTNEAVEEMVKTALQDTYEILVGRPSLNIVMA